MADDLRLSVALSETELRYLLDVLGLGDLPGFTHRTPLDPETSSRARSMLIEKNYAKDNDQLLFIHEELAGIVALSAKPKRALNIDAISTERTVEHWFYMHEQFSIYHRHEADAHVFQSIEQGIDWLIHLGRVFDLLPADEHEKAGDNHKLTIVINLSSLDETPHALLFALPRYLVSLFERRDGDVAAIGMQVVAFDGRYWRLSRTGDSVKADAHNVESIIEMIFDMLHTALQIT